MQFRLYSRLDVSFSDGFSVFFGPNGAGKTTILEALYFLMTLKSFRSSRNTDLIGTPYTECGLSAKFEDPSIHAQIELKTRGQKKELDGKAIRKTLDFCKHFSVVALCPEHQGILSGAPEERRKYLDRVLFSQEAPYLNKAQRYRKALKHKQALLREDLSFEAYKDQVSPWNQEILALGQEMRRARRQMIDTLTPRFKKHHGVLFEKDEVNLSYECSTTPLEEELQERGRQEYFAKRVLFGPHRDDVLISLRGRKAAEIASQGERASLLLSLKLSEIELAEEGMRSKPILLLDDLGATLDMGRRERLLDFLKTGSHQTLITTTEPSLVEVLRGMGSQVLEPQKTSLEEGISIARWLPA